MTRIPSATSNGGNGASSASKRGGPLTNWWHGLRRKVRHHRHGADLAEPMRDENPQRYLDPAVLARFGLSPLVAKLVVEGFINGLHRS
ncbi:MAG: hypothetical protein ACODAQ_01200, partial [Phycisphaeraceae bacterium]